jgi:predicted PurR-regulated permease PerM
MAIEQNIGLWIAIIGASSAIVGSMVSQGFNLITKRIEHNHDRFTTFLDQRVKAHENIARSVYESKDVLNNFKEYIKNGIPRDKEFVTGLGDQGYFSSWLYKINEAVYKNSIWPDIKFLRLIGVS